MMYARQQRDMKTKKPVKLSSEAQFLLEFTKPKCRDQVFNEKVEDGVFEAVFRCRATDEVVIVKQRWPQICEPKINQGFQVIKEENKMEIDFLLI